LGILSLEKTFLPDTDGAPSLHEPVRDLLHENPNVRSINLIIHIEKKHG
jgi:hypothetical protein